MSYSAEGKNVAAFRQATDNHGNMRGASVQLAKKNPSLNGWQAGRAVKHED